MTKDEATTALIGILQQQVQDQAEHIRSLTATLSALLRDMDDEPDHEPAARPVRRTKTQPNKE